ncbi:hypothetical protein K437DRAFT_114998 [Tilletiaria anomala UBC 951]|uniref:RING-type domain-containing protein n=1 Tax=Tilletiaria anomala (strain ATCC 24038 / CBS 436.72 / UBC 951) TaxID=1037660 RepID=A0A066WQX6_TILAU|nr:uncharacterized protein K437DRAFT_114998 [Tilletiaria anomala UBC 951]KDN53050.1 hypothetical protein K437DRAFT_114998 [Tilletiaria anomala UBC 951]
MSSSYGSGSSSSISRRFNFDTIHCWTCFKDFVPPGQARGSSASGLGAAFGGQADKTEEFWLTSCSHVICADCMRHRGDAVQKVCAFCKAVGIKQIVLNENIPPHIAPFFRSPPQVLDEVIASYKFQHEHTLHLISYLKAQARKQQEILERVKSELIEAREVKRNQHRLLQENEQLRAQLGQYVNNDGGTTGNRSFVPAGKRPREPSAELTQTGTRNEGYNAPMESDFRLTNFQQSVHHQQAEVDLPIRQVRGSSVESDASQKLQAYRFVEPTHPLPRNVHASSISAMPPPGFVNSSRVSAPNSATARPSSALPRTNGSSLTHARFPPMRPTSALHQEQFRHPSTPSQRAPFRPATAMGSFSATSGTGHSVGIGAGANIISNANFTDPHRRHFGR